MFHECLGLFVMCSTIHSHTNTLLALITDADVLVQSGLSVMKAQSVHKCLTLTQYEATKQAPQQPQLYSDKLAADYGETTRTVCNTSRRGIACF